MKSKKSLVILGLLAGMLVFCTLTSQVLAGAGIEPPPEGANIIGPEIWGVVVIRCPGGASSNSAIVRVKYVDNCNVYTQAIVDPNWTIGCPANASEAEGQSLPTGTQFIGPSGTPFTGTPFITKVKNFRTEATGGIVSFDAQFKFWTP